MSSVFRSLRSIFTSKPSASATLKPNIKPTTTTAAAPSKPKKTTKSPKYSRPSSSKPEDFKTEVAGFKKLCGTRRFRDNAHPFEDLVRRLTVAGKYSYIEEIIEYQKIYEGSIKRENFVVRLISLYGKAQMFEHAQKLFDEMPQLNCDRTVLSFNALLTACVNSKKYDKLGELFGELPEKLSIEPNVRVDNSSKGINYEEVKNEGRTVSLG